MARLRRAVLWQVLGSVAGAALLFWLAPHFPFLQYVQAAQHRVEQMGTWAGVLYPLLYAACNILLLPGGTLAVGSGLFFGLWWGFFLNVVGSVLSASVAFTLSRWAMRRWVRARLLRHPRGRALDAAVAREGWKIVFLSQVHPLAPSSLLQYLYGVTSIRFATCLLWVTLGQMPGAFLYAYLGTLAQLGLRLWQGETHLHPLKYVLWTGGLLLTILLTTLLGRLALRLLAEAEAAATQPHFVDLPQGGDAHRTLQTSPLPVASAPGSASLLP